MTLEQLKELAIYAAKNEAPTNFSVDNVDAALADGLRDLAGSVNQFMKNRYDIYDIIITAVDEVVPKNVMDAVSIFAEVQQVPQGQKAIFKQKVGRTRAKQFLTQVGLSGVYETFRLDNKTFELGGHAVGGATTLDFERMLDGAEIMSEYVDVLTEAQTEAVYKEIHKALRAALNDKPATNKVIENKFDADKMFKLCSVVKAYGNGAVIFAPPEFVGAMGPDAIVPVGTNYQGIYHPQDIDRIHNEGYINIFRGTPIVQIPQSYVDENNKATYIDPQLAYVLPTGGDRVVKVVLEGPTQIYDWTNKDNSLEINTYRKLGVAILTQHNWGIYQNAGITQTYQE